MSILIKGMEMPKEGRLTLQISADGAVYVVKSCSITAETYTTDAVPVPPHGLIAREQVLDAIRLELAQANACNDMDDYDSWMRVFDYVRKFPTIIPTERVNDV